jgi:hypothetical protein
MTAIDTTDIVAWFAAIYVAFDGGGDVPEVPSTGAVAAYSGGLILLSSHPDHRPRIVIDTEPGPLAGTPWADCIPLFQQVMDIPGPTIRIYDGFFNTDVEFDWTQTGSKQVRVYRTGDTVLDELHTIDVDKAVGIEQWLITLTDPRSS